MLTFVENTLIWLKAKVPLAFNGEKDEIIDQESH